MVRKIWNHFEEYLLVGSLAFSVALVFLQVVMRYVFQQSLSWSEELAATSSSGKSGSVRVLPSRNGAISGSKCF
jgi:hypothetical protein